MRQGQRPQIRFYPRIWLRAQLERVAFISAHTQKYRLNEGAQPQLAHMRNQKGVSASTCMVDMIDHRRAISGQEVVSPRSLKLERI